MCEGREHLQKVLKEVVDRHGEGLMLRKAEASYDVGRSYSMLKVKLQQDAEVKMLRKAKKCVGFDAMLPNNAEITIRCTYTDFKYPPPAGAVLKVKHFGEWEKTGKLKNPFFWRVRNDGATWDDIVTRYNLDRGIEINTEETTEENQQKE
uniref:ATP-dependent DNA ligase family profile domain-containing protein n=1 Tax=Vannella robusta TaxID=1487602 RepID=A0A7S4M7I3_9EUKA